MKVETLRETDLEIDYVNFGKKGKNIVIIPGLFSSIIDIKKQRFLFLKYYKDLAKEYNVYIFGKNKNINADYTIDNMATDQIKALELLGIDKTYLVGISQGGMIAQTVAIKNKGIVEKLIICVSTSKTNPTTKKVINNWINLSKEKELNNLVTDVMSKSLHDQKVRKLKKFYFLLDKLKEKISYDNFIIHATSCVNHDSQKDLSKIECPVFIVAAEKDEVIDCNDSVVMSKFIKNNKLKIYSDMGHDIYSNSQKVNKDIIDFIKE